jgi:hypothetical protein
MLFRTIRRFKDLIGKSGAKLMFRETNKRGVVSKHVKQIDRHAYLVVGIVQQQNPVSRFADPGMGQEGWFDSE